MNMRHTAYRQSTATSWTRIDMLLALYDGSLFAVQHALQAIQVGKQDKLITHRHRAQRLITELLAGVDAEQGELANNVYRLLMFCLMQTTESTADEWKSVASILQQLRDAFAEIRDEAARLEQIGQIPKLGHDTAELTLAIS